MRFMLDTGERNPAFSFRREVAPFRKKPGFFSTPQFVDETCKDPTEARRGRHVCR